jgi:polysaccharide deacetylase family protein (PEP-CTERM system associated)
MPSARAAGEFPLLYAGQPVAIHSGRSEDTMHPLLFSVDVEEFYPARRGDPPRSAPVQDLVARYLDLLEALRARGTFFVVGELARKLPALIARIVAAGHEIACHGDRHQTLDGLDPAGFAADLRANRAALQAAGAPSPRGFRAPIFSLTAATSWAYRVLADEGFTYSSSVLPAPNPLFGWPEFGPLPRTVDGVCELPMTIGSVLGHRLPLFGGTYFRVLPYQLLRPRLRAALRAGPVQAYFHPYDVDVAQPWVMHAGVHGKRVLNALLFLRRGSLPRRLRLLLQEAGSTRTYSELLRAQAI